jgi:prepilin-type N-terminal cleavage/methylation domain-containing protein
MTVGAERPAGSFAALAKAGRDGRGRNTRPARAAFTLLEILLALALLALLSAATVSISENLVGNTPVTPEEVFWKALAEARKEALTSEQEVHLSFDPKAKAFNLVTTAGTEAGADPSANSNSSTQTFPVTKASDELAIEFLPVDKNSVSTVLIGGELIETQAMPYVTFYSDGTCSPFRAQFHSGGTARIIAIDPWTCTQVLETKENP